MRSSFSLSSLSQIPQPRFGMDLRVINNTILEVKLTEAEKETYSLPRAFELTKGQVNGENVYFSLDKDNQILDLSLKSLRPFFIEAKEHLPDAFVRFFLPENIDALSAPQKTKGSEQTVSETKRLPGKMSISRKKRTQNPDPTSSFYPFSTEEKAKKLVASVRARAKSQDSKAIAQPLQQRIHAHTGVYLKEAQALELMNRFPKK